MPEYTYRGINRIGKQIKGSKIATDLDALEAELAKTGSVLLEAEGSRKRGSGSTDITFFNRAPKSREVVDFFITLRSLLKAGVPLREGLTTIMEEVESPVLQSIIKDIISSVEEGRLISDALGDHPKVFSEHVLGMVKSGEFAGKLEESFEELIRYLEWQMALKASVKQATIYPIIVLFALCAFIGILFTFVVPTFTKLLISLEVPLPLPTRIVMSISEFFVAAWWILLLVGVITPFVFRYARKHSIRFALAVDTAKLKLAVFGELNRLLIISKFAFNFSALFESGVPIIKNLELCESVVGNKVVAMALAEARTDVEGGMFLNESLRKHENIFPSKALLLITVGETSGSLGEAFKNLADYYSEEIPRKLKKAFSILEPAVMLTLIGVVGFVALAILLPMLSLFGAVGG